MAALHPSESLTGREWYVGESEVQTLAESWDCFTFPGLPSSILGVLVGVVGSLLVLLLGRFSLSLVGCTRTFFSVTATVVAQHRSKKKQIYFPRDLIHN